MSSENPLVSVVVCAYNAGAFLRPAIRSVVNQTYRNIDILLIDDGSTDGSVDSIREIVDARIRIIRQDNLGKSVALNRALSELSGDFYAIHDADDLCHPERIEKQVRHLLKHPELSAVFCGHSTLLDNCSVAPRSRAKGPDECRADIDAFRMPAHDPTVMFRMSAVRGLQYEPSLRIGQGYDYILRVGEVKPMAVLGECLYSYRIHRTSNTKRDPVRRQLMIQEVWRRACTRRGLDFDTVFSEEATKLLCMPDNNLYVDFIESAVDLRHAGKYLEAIRTGLDCVAMAPLCHHNYKALAYAILPDPLRRRIRPSERHEA